MQTKIIFQTQNLNRRLRCLTTNRVLKSPNGQLREDVVMETVTDLTKLRLLRQIGERS